MTRIIFSPDSKSLATISDDKTAKLWDVLRGQLKFTLQERGEWVFSATFNSEGSLVLTGSTDGYTRVWGTRAGQLKLRIEGMAICPRRFSSYDDTVTTGSKGNTLRLWNAETGALKSTLKADKRFFSGMSRCTTDGQTIVSFSGEASAAILWEAQTGRLLALLKPTKDDELFYEYRGRKIGIYQADFSPNGQIVATVDSYNRVELWQATTGRLKATLTGHLDSIYNLEFSTDGRLLATASRDGTARVWDVSTGQLKNTLKAGHQIARRVEFSPDGTIVAVGYQNQARLWNVNSGQLIVELPEDKDVSRTTLFGTYPNGIELRFSPDGRLLLTMGAKTVKAWDAKTGKFMTTLEGARPPVAFSSNGKLLATAGRDNSVLLWEISSQ